ncbi:L,D-transpeptidase [Herbaspirillum sp. RV1423]|uniref:L,D-transpeptidase n=1 Tax=Herbaspirillum sp. RV1423 TaxID=1443993 RepID=UPI0004AEEF8D|nr:L,D-transpeptidase [Herbaspirillum sp. RV1423]
MAAVAAPFSRLAAVLTAAVCLGFGIEESCVAQTMPDELVVIYRQYVAPALAPPIEEQSLYADFVRKALQDNVPESPQYVILVDRSAQVQAIFLFWLEEGKSPLFIGASPVSTGRVGQYDHFETPTGVFEHSIDNPDFRAEGTKNALGVRGYGVKGMRVFDFGWQQATRGWGSGGLSTMRLQMHATDPTLLESRLGTIQSKGCIRIPASLNRLLDAYGIIDADYEAAVSNGIHLSVPMPAPRVHGPGRYLIVMDSQRTTRPEWATPPFFPRVTAVPLPPLR